MRSLPILSAPRHSKRKKKKRKGAKNTRKSPRDNSPSIQTTIVLVGAPEKKTLVGKGSDVNCAAKTGDARAATSTACLDHIKQIKPFPKPSNISMGHRKQTARKSHSNLAINLPKERLIAVLKSQISSSSEEAGTKSLKTAQNTSLSEKLAAPSCSLQKPIGSSINAVAKKHTTSGSNRDFQASKMSPAKVPIYPEKSRNFKASSIEKTAIGLSKYAKGFSESTFNSLSDTNCKTTPFRQDGPNQTRCADKHLNTVAEKRNLQAEGSPVQQKKFKRQET